MRNIAAEPGRDRPCQDAAAAMPHEHDRSRPRVKVANARDSPAIEGCANRVKMTPRTILNVTDGFPLSSRIHLALQPGAFLVRIGPLAGPAPVAVHAVRSLTDRYLSGKLPLVGGRWWVLTTAPAFCRTAVPGLSQYRKETHRGRTGPHQARQGSSRSVQQGGLG